MKPSNVEKEEILGKGLISLIANALTIPGIGSLWAGWWLQGGFQLIIGGVGILMLLWALFKINTSMHEIRESLEASFEVPDVIWDVLPLGLIGFVLFKGAWLWALFTSYQIAQKNKKQEAR